MSSYLQAAQPPDASATVRGLVSIAAQSFAGLKTFRDGAEVQLQTAGASDRALRVGTTVADGSVDRSMRLLSVLTGMGGTEKEWLYVRRPTSYGDSPLVVENQGLTNFHHINLFGAGAGVGGVNILGGGNVGSLQLHAGQNGGPAYLAVINKGLHISQNSNAYDTSMLMKFTVEVPGGVAATVPVFDFRSTAALQANQRLLSLKVLGSEVFDVSASGVINGTSGRATGFGAGIATAGGSGLQVGTAGVSVTASAFELLLAGGWGLADVAGTRAIRLNSGTPLTTGSLLGIYNGASEKLKVGPDGTIEATTAGVGLVLRSPDSTRWRLTITNAGAVSIAAA